MTTRSDIEALGIEVPKTRDYDLHCSDTLNGAPTPDVIERADEMEYELLAVIERLVASLHAEEVLYELTMKRAEQAEADLAAMREPMLLLDNFIHSGINADLKTKLYDSLRLAQNALAAMTKERDEYKAIADGFPTKLVFQSVPVDESVDEMLHWREEARKWEWVAKDVTATLVIASGMKGDAALREQEIITNTLARYQPGEKPRTWAEIAQESNNLDAIPLDQPGGES